MLKTQRIKSILALVLCACFLASCQSDETKFSNDAIATAEVRKIAQEMDSGDVLTNEEFEFLKTQFNNYPKSPTLRKHFEKALFTRQDWGALGVFYESLGADINEDQKRNLAKVNLKLGKYEEAYAAAKDYDLKNELEMRIVAATSLFQLGRYGEAKKLLDGSWESIVKDKSLDEMAIRGMIYFYEGENAKAIETLTKVTEFESGNITANNGLSRIYQTLGDGEKAKAAQERVQESFDKMTAIEQQQAQNVEKSHKLEAAYKAKRFEEVIVLAKELESVTDARNRIMIYNYLYNSYTALGQQDEAEKVKQKAKQLQQK